MTIVIREIRIEPGAPTDRQLREAIRRARILLTFARASRIRSERLRIAERKVQHG